MIWSLIAYLLLGLLYVTLIEFLASDLSSYVDIYTKKQYKEVSLPLRIIGLMIGYPFILLTAIRSI
jgi:hypothetical protein